MNVVQKYKHVGSYHARNCSNLPELRYRASEASSAMKEIAVISRSKMSSSYSCRILIRSLAISRLTVNIATIPSWEITAVKMFNATYMKCYRASVLTRKFDGSCEQISNQDLCQKNLDPSSKCSEICYPD